MKTEEILKFILDHIRSGTIDLVFNQETLDAPNKTYVLEPFGIKISVEMLEDIKSDPDHYKKFVANNVSGLAVSSGINPQMFN